MTNFPNGLASFGVPLPAIAGVFSTGTYYFVNSVIGSNGNTGKDKAHPLATVDAAVGKCTADKGDVIVVMPGHAETLTAATSLVLDVAGITVINVGTGKSAPVYTFGTATSAEITVNADDVRWIGGRMVANLDNVATAFQVDTAKDANIEGVIFEDNSAALHFLSCVVTTTTDNAADGLVVKNCQWRGLAVAPNAFISILGDIDGLEVIGNYANMAATNDVGHFITFAAKNGINTRIEGNRLVVVGATTAAVGIFLTGSGTAHTGYAGGNWVTSLDTTGELIATAGTGLAWFENYYTGTADASGKLWPTVDAA